MSDLLYHKELNEAQWNRIKCLFEESKKVGRPPLNPRKVFNGILWIVGAIYLPVTVIGTAFTTNSENGARVACLNCYCIWSTPTLRTQLCLKLIQRFAKYIRVLVRR